jgi:hypothetical protein
LPGPGNSSYVAVQKISISVVKEQGVHAAGEKGAKILVPGFPILIEGQSGRPFQSLCMIWVADDFPHRVHRQVVQLGWPLRERACHVCREIATEDILPYKGKKSYKYSFVL